MASDSRAILQLLAAGRIDAAEAERLLTVTGADRETVWALAGCAVMIVLARFNVHAFVPVVHWLGGLVNGVPGLSHLLTMVMSGVSMIGGVL